MTTASHDGRVVDKIRMDLRVWSDLWKTPIGPKLFLRLALLEPGFQVALSIRFQEALTHVPVLGKTLRRVLWYFTTIWHGCDIAPGVRMGGGIFMPHPLGIVIGGDCTIGRNVQVNQGVTIGNVAAQKGSRSSAPQSPVVGDGASIFSGAVVAGGITIGEGSFVGANAVVLRDVPDGHTAVGVPARLIAPRASADVSNAGDDVPAAALSENRIREVAS